MFRHCLLRPVSALILSSVITSADRTGQAADHPLQAIPESASVVTRFKQPQASINKVAALAGKIDERLAAQVQQMGLAAGALISNPGQAGVDRSGDWWIAVFPVSDGDPGVVFAIPATDAEAMKTAVLEATKDAPGDEYQFVVHDNWLLYTNARHALDLLEKCAKGEVQPVSGVIDSESRAVIAGSDLSAFINVQELRTIYQDELDAVQVRFDEFMEQLENFSQPNQGFDMKAAAGIYRTLFRGLLQAVEDATSYTAGLAVDDSGLAIEELCRFTAGSATINALKPHQPAELTVLGKLPEGQLGYYAVHGDMGRLMQWGMDLTAQMFSSDEKTKQSFETISKEYAKLKQGATAVAFMLGELDGGCLRTTQLTEVAEAPQMRDALRSIAKSGSELQFGQVKQTIDFRTDAEKYGSRSGDLMIIKQEFDEESDPLGMQKKFSEVLFGPDGISTRVVYLENLVVQTTGGGRESMQAALDAVDAKSPRSDNGPALTSQTRSKLAKTANLVLMVDLPRLVCDALRLIVKSGQFPIPVDPDMLSQLLKQPSYAGLSVTVEPQGMRSHVYVPVEQMQGIANIVTYFQAMRQQPEL